MLNEVAISYRQRSRVVHAARPTLALVLSSDIETFGLQGSSWFEVHDLTQLPLPSAPCTEHWTTSLDRYSQMLLI